MRVFIAAELPFELREALAESSAALRSSVRGRFVSPENFHVTLAFLGNVEAWRIADAAEVIDQAVATSEAFELQLGELGSFGRRKSATLWQGFRPNAGHDALCELTRELRADLKTAGFSFDEKKFLAHVTLMRAAQLEGGELPYAHESRGTIETVTLFRSDLSGPHPIYEALHRAKLRKASELKEA